MTTAITTRRFTWLYTMLLACCLASSACVPQIYRIDVAQGNLLLDAEIAQLRPGMSRQQVFDLLGTPVQRNPFSTDQWLYVSSQQKAGSPAPVRRLTLTFQNDQLISIDQG